MHKYTYIKIEDWCGLWRDDELVHEGHDMSIPELADNLTGGCFELVVYSYPDEGEHRAAFDPEQGFGSFEDKPLADWLPLCGEPR